MHEPRSSSTSDLESGCELRDDMTGKCFTIVPKVCMQLKLIECSFKGQDNQNHVR